MGFESKNGTITQKTCVAGQESNLRRCLIGVILLCFCAGLATSCGYRLRQDGRPLGLEIRRLAVPLVKSTASNLGFEGEFSKIVREEFISHSNLHLVSSAGADAILLAGIVRISTRPIGYDITNTTVQDRAINYEVTNRRRIWINVDARLIDGKSGNVIWLENGIREQGEFAVSEDPLETRYNRQLAVRGMARNLARRLFAKTMERF